MNKKRALPKDLQKYFWDCDLSEFDWEKYRFFTTERILNFGDSRALKWLKQHAVETRFFKQVVRKSRALDEKTKNFWITLYGK